MRKQVPRASHGDWAPAADRPDPLNLLQAQDEGRLQHLLPIKYGRMVESPFAFLRGSAVIMAADLAPTPTTGLAVQLCGDAHLSNFGVFATPERRLVFDINDFDETYPGPWEWDLKRLAASAAVAGRENGFKDRTNRELARVVARTYQKAMASFAQMPILDIWYYHVEAKQVVELFDEHARKAAKSTRKMVRKARARTQRMTLEKMTEVVDGRRRIVNDPPLLLRLSDLPIEGASDALSQAHVEDVWAQYLASLPVERRRLLERFRITDAALRVGGVGSVGTWCAITLLEGEDDEDAIILQQKEAGPSALEPYLTKVDHPSQAERVVHGQRLMQAASDIFLGWHTGFFTKNRYYWRQLKDMKGSVDPSVLDERGLGTYLAVCSICLARAHARSGDAATISGYLGKGKAFQKAIGNFSVAYADQTERDYEALVEAVKAGRIAAETGI